MPLLVAQLLFADPHDDAVNLDVVVLDRAEAPASPAVGTPLCFTFGLLGDERSQYLDVATLHRWAASLATIRMELVEVGCQRFVHLVSDDAEMTVSTPLHVR